MPAPLLLRAILTAIMLPSVLLLSGCFTAMAATSGINQPGTKKPMTLNQTVPLDAITAPLQAPLLALVVVKRLSDDSARANSVAAKSSKLRLLLCSDPDRAWRERWDRKDEAHVMALRNSFVLYTEHTVVYSESTLEAFYTEIPSVRDDLFLNPGCSADFLRKHFAEVYQLTCERGVQGDGYALTHLILNKNCPLDLVEIVAASSGKIPASPCGSAENVLILRGAREPYWKRHPDPRKKE